MVNRLRLLLAGFAGPPLGRRILQASLLVGGLSMVAIGAVFLLGSSWNQGPRVSAAAAESDARPAAMNSPAGRTLDMGPALAKVDPNTLFGGRLQFNVARHPTAAPTLEPTPTPRPAPPIPQPPAPQLPASQPSNSDPAPHGCPTASMSGFALDLFNSVNDQRTQAGLSALEANGCVIYVAYLRSQDMAANSYFSHTSPSGETAFSLMDSNAVPYGWAGENLARDNYPDDQTVAVSVADLMASPGHRDNILSTNYTEMGVGFAEDSAGMKYYTMVFIGPP